MTYRVVRLRTGETYAAYAQRHYHQAIAAALDAARIAGEPFAVYGVLHEFGVLFVTPENEIGDAALAPH
jgi:hypothetical protein